jgi:hypothetical protein
MVKIKISSFESQAKSGQDIVKHHLNIGQSTAHNLNARHWNGYCNFMFRHSGKAQSRIKRFHSKGFFTYATQVSSHEV